MRLALDLTALLFGRAERCARVALDLTALPFGSAERCARVALVALLVACRRPAPVAAPPSPPRVAAIAIDTAVPVDAAEEPDGEPADAPWEEADANLAESFPVEKQSIGPLRIGMTDKQVVRLLGKPMEKSPPVMMGATGEFMSHWEYPGVFLQMAANTEKGPTRVSSIEITAPSAYRTPEGIGIGSTRAEIVAVYGPYIGHSNDPKFVLVGSVYFGLAFAVDEDRVTSVFLGAMAF